ncbi:MAG: alpha/beta fold hydrolase [Elusimicrobiota bacterium]|nr:alpha/beta fold hydrolase [Elusimicrobiota bacterium]
MMSVLAALLAGAALSAPAPTPKAVTRPVTIAGESVELKTADGWTLKAAWSRAQEGKRTFVLLHGTGQRKEDWKRLAVPLARAGYGYLAVDLRGHGESRVTPSGEAITWKKLRVSRGVNDYAEMARDVEAAAGWLAGQGVPEDTIGLIGAEVGGSLAMKYAAVRPKVPALVMLSPGLAWQDIPIINAVRAYKNRPVLMVHSEADKKSSKETPLIYQFAKMAAGERNTTLIVVPQERGTRLFRANRDLARRVVAWLDDPIKPEPLPDASTQTPAAASSAPSEAPAVSPVVDPAADEEAFGDE